jgi:hypothetical protein
MSARSASDVQPGAASSGAAPSSRPGSRARGGAPVGAVSQLGEGRRHPLGSTEGAASELWGHRRLLFPVLPSYRALESSSVPTRPCRHTAN